MKKIAAVVLPETSGQKPKKDHSSITLKSKLNKLFQIKRCVLRHTLTMGVHYAADIVLFYRLFCPTSAAEVNCSICQSVSGLFQPHMSH